MFTCVLARVSDGCLSPSLCCPWPPLAGCLMQEQAVGVLHRTCSKGTPARVPPAKSCWEPGVEGCSARALPGKPFPRKSPLRCDGSLAGEGGACRPTGRLSPRTLSGGKARVCQPGRTNRVGGTRLGRNLPGTSSLAGGAPSPTFLPPSFLSLSSPACFFSFSHPGDSAQLSSPLICPPTWLSVGAWVGGGSHLRPQPHGLRGHAATSHTHSTSGGTRGGGH